ncbi:hypothetical protein CMK17_17360 [Candidatus Poribacteria bacterium]|nr:hypothetical protein [Candidatus Poribacteria bacterium]
MAKQTSSLIFGSSPPIILVLVIATLIFQGCAHQAPKDFTVEYIGERKNGIPHGQGSYTWANGDQYIGNWKEGKRHGQGTYTWVNGDEYTGKWEEHKMHGSGTLTDRFGGTLRGEWKDNKIWSGIDRTADHKVIGTYVLGKWKKQKPHSPSVSKSKNKTSCSSSRTCWTKKCLTRAIILGAMGRDTTLWMYKCMALGGYSWPASGSRVSCTGPYCQNESAWDYLPGSRQWRCRDTGGARGGEFVPSSECSSQQQVDNWP